MPITPYIYVLTHHWKISALIYGIGENEIIALRNSEHLIYESALDGISSARKYGGASEDAADMCIQLMSMRGEPIGVFSNADPLHPELTPIAKELIRKICSFYWFITANSWDKINDKETFWQGQERKSVPYQRALEIWKNRFNDELLASERSLKPYKFI